MEHLSRWWNNPILVKELQWRMRAKRTPWVILTYLSIMGAIVLAMLDLMLIFLFTALSVVQLLMISFVVPGLTAGLISGERERQTLAVLLTTPLSSSRIILNKWLASLSFTILLVVASLPLYVMVYLFGGISFVHVGKVFAHFLVTIFFLGSLGLFTSTLIKRTSVSTVVAYVTMALIWVGLLILLFFYASLVLPAPNDTSLFMEAVGGLHPALSLFYGIFGEVDLPHHQKYILNLYDYYLIAYSVFSVLLLYGSVWYLSPSRVRRHRG
jgi:ABC-type transport system involved in multi-copper enzyme maturation permease subunit